MTRIKKTNIYGPKKTCETCEKLLSRSQFHKHYQTEDGKQPHCKDCMREKIRIGKDNSAMNMSKKMERNVIVKTPAKAALVLDMTMHQLIENNKRLLAITNGPDADEVHPGTKRTVRFGKNGKMSITYNHKGK